MEYKWNHKFNNIGLKFEPRVVRIKNDPELKQYLLESKMNALLLADLLKKNYYKRFEKELEINTISLATEISCHFWLQEISFMIENKVGKNRFTDWMLRHMDVIDCGEKAIDNNRFLWDLLAKFRHRL